MEESDFFRNRLTHSLEVAQIACSIAAKINYEIRLFRKNGIDPDIVETAALAHDLGHPPFGHNGERALDDCMKACGGFEGNAQSFRIVGRLEKKDVRGDFPSPIENETDQRLGLNWTYRSLAGIVKYDRIIPQFREANAELVKGVYADDKPLLDRVKLAVCPSLPEGHPFRTIEASIMDLADDIAYSTYDLEDTFKSGFLNPLTILSVLSADDRIITRVAAKVSNAVKRNVTSKEVLVSLYDVLESGFPSNVENELAIATAVDFERTAAKVAQDGYLRTKFTADLVSSILASVEVHPNTNWPMLSYVTLTDEALMKVECLKHFTYIATIMSPRLRVAEARGYDLVVAMFKKLAENHLLMPGDFRNLYESFSDDAAKKRVIADYIAGMTDRYAVEFYGRIVSETPTTIFKPF